jgi:hypothetical protein
MAASAAVGGVQCYRIVAEISSDQLAAYLDANQQVRDRVHDALARVGVRAIVARSADPVFDAAPWRRVSGTEFALLEASAP